MFSALTFAERNYPVSLLGLLQSCKESKGNGYVCYVSEVSYQCLLG